MPKDSAVKAVKNEQAMTKVLDDFVKKAHSTLAECHDMHGSIALTLYFKSGQIGRSHITVDQSRDCLTP